MISVSLVFGEGSRHCCGGTVRDFHTPDPEGWNILSDTAPYFVAGRGGQKLLIHHLVENRFNQCDRKRSGNSKLAAKLDDFFFKLVEPFVGRSHSHILTRPPPESICWLLAAANDEGSPL